MAAQRNALVTVTRASLTLAAALSLARVFEGGGWYVALAVAAVVPPALFSLAISRRWNVLVGGLLVVVAGAWLALIVDTPSETVAGFPAGSALSTFAHDLSQSPHVLRSATVPVIPTGAALVLAFLATYVAAAATDIAARRLDAPIGAVGPSVALYVAIAALGSGRWAPTTACYALALVAYFVALHNAELGARRTWFQAGRNRRSQAVTGGVAAGALVVAFAIAVGPAFPGARGGALINYRKLGTGRGASALDAPSPFLSIASKLTRDRDTTLFTVDDKTVATRWRLIALDDFNHGKSDEWGLGDTQASVSDLPGPSHKAGAQQLVQHIRIENQVDPYWLPAAYRPISINLPGVNVLPASTTLFVNRPIAEQEYTVTSEIWTPSVQRLQAVTMADLAPMVKDTELPDNFSKRVGRLAEGITASAATPYEKAVALENFFQGSHFTYDQSVDYQGDPHALETFLGNGHGFCEQFAAAFGEMARSVGLPTRIAVGFQAGTLVNGVWQVKGADAHAWPEVWLGRDIGWYAFEPTKGRADPVTRRGDQSLLGPARTTPRSTTPTTRTRTTSPPNSAVTIPPKDPNSIRIDGGAGSTSHTSAARRALVAIGVVGSLLVLAALATLVTLAAIAWRRTRRRRDAPDTRRRVLGAWAEALERLAAAGVTPRPSATSIEFALRHAPAHGAGGAGPALMDLARLHTAAMFAPDPPSSTDADAAWRNVDEIARALRNDVSRSERVISRLRIRPRDRHVLADRR